MSLKSYVMNDYMMVWRKVFAEVRTVYLDVWCNAIWLDELSPFVLLRAKFRDKNDTVYSIAGIQTHWGDWAY